MQPTVVVNTQTEARCPQRKQPIQRRTIKVRLLTKTRRKMLQSRKICMRLVPLARALLAMHQIQKSLFLVQRTLERQACLLKEPSCVFCMETRSYTSVIPVKNQSASSVFQWDLITIKYDFADPASSYLLARKSS
jgi:hypothetical protein